ncbi:MAG: YggS family pyridoxal phosphate-dependent enzyme [Clostridia bacterium]|nr:YggS family pyridoxal phosphate-dependent enzyme [Clostridia bacterium]MDD4047698.1 YggS family pyridoxal phosphate-dependent enzyme [Clostridia bacterium]
MKHIQKNLIDIRNEINEVCKSIGRDPDSVKLVAVSKTFPIEDIKVAYDDEQRLFGENRVQELEIKIPQLPSDIKWHLIGTLQRNKVKYIVDKVSLIHSVDSLLLAKEISKQALKKNIVVNILLQVNIAMEDTKHGFETTEIVKKIEEIKELPGIKVRGLMTVAPAVENPEEVRLVFRKLRKLAEYIDCLGILGIDMKELSMGMSGDFQIAIEEGATFVRVGGRIFGERY